MCQELGQPDQTGGRNFCSDKGEGEGGTGGDLVSWLSSTFSLSRFYLSTLSPHLNFYISSILLTFIWEIWNV